VDSKGAVVHLKMEKGKLLEFIDHFGVSGSTINDVFSNALSRGGDFCDIYFEHTIDNLITMEEGIVKEAVKRVSHGAGVRVVHGESAGYAYTEEVTPEKLKEASKIASSITKATPIARPKALQELTFTNRYEVEELTSRTELRQKIHDRNIGR